ncbi:Nucleotide-binding, alpha-beta plait, partial [Cynara cardunculus var. scolymus]
MSRPLCVQMWSSREVQLGNLSLTALIKLCRSVGVVSKLPFGRSFQLSFSCISGSSEVEALMINILGDSGRKLLNCMRFASFPPTFDVYQLKFNAKKVKITKRPTDSLEVCLLLSINNMIVQKTKKHKEVSNTAYSKCWLLHQTRVAVLVKGTDIIRFHQSS